MIPGDLPTQNPEALAKIPAHIIAGIAAQLHTNEGDPVERVRQACQILDAAESASKSLAEEGGYAPGLLRHQFEQKKFESRKLHIADRQNDPLCVKGEDGQPARVTFEDAVSKIFGRAIKKADRESRLVLHLAEKTPAEETLAALERWAGDQSKPLVFPKTGNAKALEIVRDWKRHGIPFEEYRSLKFNFPIWWKERVSRTQAAKRIGKIKGKQGRVRRKTDKRKGARGGNFLQALKKTA